MSLTGEFNPHLQGNRSNVDRKFRKLTITGLATLSSLGSGIIHSSSAGALSSSAVSLTADVSGILAVLNGGSGTSTPSLVAGSGIAITGSWPNQTVTANGGNLVSGTNISISGNTINVINNPTFSGLVTASAGLTVSGTTNINTSGSSAINIATNTYTGTFNIGNTGCTVNVNSALSFGATTSAPATGIYNLTSTGMVITGDNFEVFTNLSTPTVAFLVDNTFRTLTRFSIMDDGNGHMTLHDQNSGTPLTLDNQQAAATTNNGILFQIGGTSKAQIKYDTTNGIQIIDTVNSVTWLKQGSTSVDSVFTKNNTLDDGTGRQAVNYSTGNAGIVMTQSTSGNRCDIRFTNSADSTSAIIGLDGTGGLNADPGSLLITTTTTKPIYISPSGISAWALKAVVISSQGYTINGKGGAWGMMTNPVISAGNQTITAAQLLNWVVSGPAQSGNVTWTTDTGTNIYTAMGSPAVGTTFSVKFSNTSNSFTATIAFGTGVTGSTDGTVIAIDAEKILFFRCTGTNTFTVY